MFQAFSQRRWLLVGLWVLIIAVVVAAPAVLPVFRLNLLGRFLALSIVALGIDLIWGFTGLLSLGQGIFLRWVVTPLPCTCNSATQGTCPTVFPSFLVFMASRSCRFSGILSRRPGSP